MSGYELRPLGLGELLDRAFLLYRRNFWLFAGIMLVPAALLLPMQFFLLRNQGTALPWNAPLPQTRAVAYGYIVGILYWFVYAVVQAATTFAVSEVYLGHPSTVRAAYGRVRGRYRRVLGVSLGVVIRIAGLFLLVGIGAGVAGGLAAVMTRGNTGRPNPAIALIPLTVILLAVALVGWFSMRYAVSIPAVLLESIKGRAAIRRSVQLTRGRRAQVFVAILLGLVVTYAMAFLFQGPFYAGIALAKMKGQLPTWLVLSMSASSTIGGVIAGPLLMIILVVFYYDLRIRKEAFDLQQMIAALPEPNPVESSSRT